MRLATVLALSLSTIPLSAQISPGHRLYSPRPGTDTHLVDNEGQIVHTWPSAYTAGLSSYVLDDGSLLRAILTSTTRPSELRGSGGGIERLDFNGNVLWQWFHDTGGVVTHHDIEPMPNGNVLMIVWEEKTVAETIAMGRDPANVPANTWPDSIIEVEPVGATGANIVWEWHAWDHMIQDFDVTKANFGVVSDHPELIDINSPKSSTIDLHHVNSVEYDPVNDWVLLSAHTQSEIWIIDHSTTTAEAAGHTGGAHGKGGDLLYRWGNPAIYGRGTSIDQTLFRQHSAKFIPPGYPGEGHITVFNNQAAGGSQVIEIELPLDAQGDFILPQGGTYGPAAPLWIYADPGNFESLFMSSAERMPNGNTLICSSLEGRIFEIDPIGTIVWEIATPAGIQAATFHSTYVERTLWDSGDTLSASAGGTLEMDYLGGSARANEAYMLWGSFSGSSPGFTYRGVHIPLNFDQYTKYLLMAPAGPFHSGNYGQLDSLGRAHATFTIPGNVASAGLTLDHAFVTAHYYSLRVKAASNAERVVFTP